MKISGFAVLCFLFLPGYVFAGWEVSKPNLTIPREPYFKAGKIKKPSFIPPTYIKYHPYVKFHLPNQYDPKLGPKAPVYGISISGSLKDNLERIMGRYRWKTVWKAPYDYNFDGKVTGSSLENVLEKLFQPFPLQAVMYTSNRTIVIVSRDRF